nr:hypothetical protein [Tanacetum cinerariifolium]
MSTQQDIYAAGSESRPPMLNKENYVPWSSRLLRYAKSRPNRTLIHNSIINGPYVRRMIPEPGDINHKVPVNKTFHVQTDDELTENELKQIEADDQAIQTILLGLPKDIYVAVDIYETAQEIWLRVQQMMKGSDIGIQDKKANEINNFQKRLPTQDPLALMANSNNPYAFPAPHQDQPPFNQNYMQQPMPNPEDITDPTTAMNMALALMAKAFKLNYSTPTNNNKRILPNPLNRQIAQPGMNMGHDRQMLMAGGNGENQFRQYDGKNVGNLNGYNDNGLIGVPGNANPNLNGNGNLVAARAEGNATGHNAKFVEDFKSLAKEADESLTKHKALELEIERLLRAVVSHDIMSIVQKASVVDTSNLQTKLERMKECFENRIIKRRMNMLNFGMIVTSNSVPTPQESKVMKNDKVLAPGMFRINPFKTSREEKHVPNNARASARTKPITVSQPPVITKKDVTSNSNGLSSTGIDNTKTRRPQPRSNTKNDRKVPNTVSASSRTKPITVSQPSVITKKGMNSNSNGLSSTRLDNTKTRRPQPRSNTKNDRVPSASKSSRSKNKEVKVEEHHRNLLLSKKNKHSSSACNNCKIDSQDVISKVVCAVCKKCLNSINHDVCLNIYVNGKKSRGRKHKANVSKNETQQKNQPEIKKPKKVGFIRRLTTPKTKKPRFLLRWSPTSKMFDQDGKLIVPSKSESYVNCSNGDNACTSNAMEPKIKWFLNFTSLLGKLSRFVCGASIQVVLST